MLVTQISIDLSGLSRFEYVIAKQADVNSRVIQVQLLNNGKIYVLDDQTTARVSITKPDKEEVLQDCTISNNRVEIVLDANMLAAAGTAMAEIILTGSDGAITSASFDIKIIATVTGKKTESSSDYQSFKEALAVFDKINERLNEQIDRVVTEYLKENPVTGGLTSTAKELLITVLRRALYNSNQSDNITALEAALQGSSGETTVYQITNNLTNITTNNASTTAEANTAYTATLTANTGYTIAGVKVTMSGVDITDIAYSNGVITIPSVTGSILITGTGVETGSGGDTTTELPTDGLLAYFDLRNSTAENDTSKGMTMVDATQGEGYIFAWAANEQKETNEYGTLYRRALSYDKESDASASELGTQYTVCALGYTTEVYGYTYAVGYVASNIYIANCAPKYNNEASSQTSLTGVGYGNRTKGYHMFATVVDGSIMKQYVDGELAATWNGEDYEDFVSWESVYKMGNTNNVAGKNTACVIYDRALTEVELTEVQAFFETLEVKA